MRVLPVLLLGALLAGCAATQIAAPVAPEQSATIAAAAAPSPKPLPAISPPFRKQREIEAMSAAELAKWVLPMEAARFATAELVPSRWGRLQYGILWESPRQAGLAGMCEIDGVGIGFTIVNEQRLAPQDFTDPPSRPHQVSPERRWKVIGSTLNQAMPSAAQCAADRPHWRWLPGPSAAAIYEATNLLEQAQRQARDKRVSYAYRCTQRPQDEVSAGVERPCPSGTMQKFAPQGAQSVKQVDCAGPLASARKGRCWELDYQVQQGDGYYTYWVRVGGAGRLQAVWIEQYLMPPH
jgi:hypothetical protein